MPGLNPMNLILSSKLLNIFKRSNKILTVCDMYIFFYTIFNLRQFYCNSTEKCVCVFIADILVDCHLILYVFDCDICS